MLKYRKSSRYHNFLKSSIYPPVIVRGWYFERDREERLIWQAGGRVILFSEDVGINSRHKNTKTKVEKLGHMKFRGYRNKKQIWNSIPWKIHRNEGVTSRDHLYSLSFIKKGGGEGEGLKKRWDLITSSPEKGGGELNRSLIISTTPRGQKKLISATTLSKKYDVLFHFFQVMPSTWAPALNDFVFTAWVADF